MKKLYKACLVLLMLCVLTSAACAAEVGSATMREVEGDYSETDISEVITDLPEDITVVVVPDDDDGIEEGSEANKNQAQKDAEDAGTVILYEGDSIEVYVTRDGKRIEYGDGNTYIKINIPEEYVGKGYYIRVYYTPTDTDGHIEEGQEAQVNDSTLIDSGTVTVKVTENGIYTVFIFKDKIPGRVSPQTWQSPVPVLLLATGIMAAAAAVYAGKRRFE